jgi:hypothetical protein
MAWKIVQLINPLLSILVLIFSYRLLVKTKISEVKMLLYMSFLAVLPVDLFTAVMIGNDYLLVFSTIASFFYFLKNLDIIKNKNNISTVNFIWLAFFVVIGSLSKQQGLILLIFPTSILLYLIVQKIKFHSIKIALIYSLLVVFSLSNEFWKYEQTGIFLVSNQNFYDYASGQFPGSLEKVEFTTFKIYSLFEKPFISNQTSASLPTEVFARTFFDYEWRFLSPKINSSKFVGRIAYFVGVLWIIFFIGLFITSFYRRKKLKFKINRYKILKYVPVIIGILFFAVPILQTVRFPYFSSMKSTFALSGIIILIISHAKYTKQIRLSDKLIFIIIFLNISFGILLVYTISSTLPFAVNHLSGPLWPIP